MRSSNRIGKLPIRVCDSNGTILDVKGTSHLVPISGILLTLHPRRCWAKRYSQPAPHRKIPAPGNDVDLASKRCDESGLKGLPSAPEWGASGGFRDVAPLARGCRCRSRSCAGPHRLPGQVDLTELRDGGVGNPGSSSWRQRPGRVFRVKVGGQFPPGAVLPPCHPHYPL